MAKGSAAAAQTQTTGEAGETRVYGGTPPVPPVADAKPKWARPAGYQQSGMNVDQFWVEEDGPIHGKLICAKPYVNKLTQKTNYIFVFQILEPCSTQSNKGEKFERPAAKGEIVGVWASGGMRELKSLGECMVWMMRAGEKDVGKPQPMKVYDIVHRGVPAPVRVVRADDKPSDAPADAGEDSIPF